MGGRGREQREGKRPSDEGNETEQQTKKDRKTTRWKEERTRYAWNVTYTNKKKNKSYQQVSVWEECCRAINQPANIKRHPLPSYTHTSVEHLPIKNMSLRVCVVMFVFAWIDIAFPSSALSSPLCAVSLSTSAVWNADDEGRQAMRAAAGGRREEEQAKEDICLYRCLSYVCYVWLY